MINSLWGAFIAGIAFSVIIFAVFQMGINIGIKTVINMLDGNYPAAMTFLNKHKMAAKVLPHVISARGEQ
jgi:hypothetical protein